MFRPGKLIHGSPLFLFLIIGLVVSTPSSQSETKKALNTISRFLRSKTGTSWLAGLAQAKSGPLTTAELMEQVIKSTKPDGKVSKSAKIVQKALETLKLKKGDSDDLSDAWDDLIQDIQNQDDIICLYRKDSDSSMRKTDDWKKFLKSVSTGYTVHLALDKGKKYVICLKKITVPETEDTTEDTFEVTTEEVSVEMTSKKTDLEETMEPDENDYALEMTTEDTVRTTEIDQISENGKKYESKLKFPETRKTRRFGPNVEDIKEEESESIEDDEDEDEEEEECSEEDDSEDSEEDGEDNNTDLDKKIDKVIDKVADDDTNLKPHPECNRPIILVVQNPYGSGNPNWVTLNPQVPKNPFQTTANRHRKFIYPLIKHNLHPWSRSKYPFSNKFYKHPIYPKGHYSKGHYPKGHYHRYAHPKILDLNDPKVHKDKTPELQNNSQNLQPNKYRTFYHLKTLEHPLNPQNFELRNQKSEDNLEKQDNSESKTNEEIPNFHYKSRPRTGLNLATRLIPIRPNYSSNLKRYNSLLVNRLPCLLGYNKNLTLNPQGQKCFKNSAWKPQIGNQEIPGKFRQIQSNSNPFGQVPNLILDPKFYWWNQPNNQQWFNKQVPNNQQIFPNDQATISNSEQVPNLGLDPMSNNQQWFNKQVPNNQKIFPNDQSTLSNSEPVPNLGLDLMSNNQQWFNKQPVSNNQQIFPNNQGILPNSERVPNLGRNPKFYWWNPPNKQQQWFNKQVPNNQQIFPNAPATLSNSEPVPNLGLDPMSNNQQWFNKPEVPNNQRVFPNNLKTFSNSKQVPNLGLNPMFYWWNQPNNQQWFKKQVPNNQQILPNNQKTVSNSEQVPNLGLDPISNNQKWFNKPEVPNNQQVFPNNLETFPNSEQVPNLGLNPMFYGWNQPNNYQWFNSQQMPNNQQIFPNNQANFSNPEQIPNLGLDPMSYWWNQPNFYQWFNKQQVPNNQKIFPNSQPTFSNSERVPKNIRLYPTSYWWNQLNNYPWLKRQQVPNNQQILPDQLILRNNQAAVPNSEPSLENPNKCKCPSLCEKPIELRITIEGNVDKPVKIGVLSQPGTWVNVVDNNNEGNSRRMFEGKEKNAEDETGKPEKQEETKRQEETERQGKTEDFDYSESVTENFKDELIQNPKKAQKKNETDGNDKNKKLEDQKEDKANEEKEENKDKEVEPRILPELTTVENSESTHTPTQITPPAA